MQSTALPAYADKVEIERWRSAWQTMKMRQIPGIGLIPRQAELTVGSFGEFGQRLAPNTFARNKNTGLLLGASQAQGFYVDNENTVAAALTRRLSNVNIINYAIPGQEITSSIMYLQWLMENDIHSDFTLLLSGPVDLMHRCIPYPNDKAEAEKIALLRYPRLVQLFLYPEIKIHAFENLNSGLCKPNSFGANAAVNRLLYDIKSGLNFAREHKLTFLVIIPPTPYGNRANIDNLVGTTYYEKYREPMEATISILHKRLIDHPIPGVIDLTDAFNDDPTPYFIDEDGHMTGRGNEKLARAICAHIDPSFFNSGKRTQ